MLKHQLRTFGSYQEILDVCYFESRQPGEAVLKCLTCDPHKHSFRPFLEQGFEELLKLGKEWKLDFVFLVDLQKEWLFVGTGCTFASVLGVDEGRISEEVVEKGWGDRQVEVFVHQVGQRPVPKHFVEMQQAKLQDRAYRKAVLHAMRHLDCDVYGILLGQGSTVSDAMPLFHRRPFDLSLELGFAAAEQNYPGLQILGFYQALKDVHEPQTSDFTVRILQAICAKTKRAFCLKIYVNDEGLLQTQMAGFQWRQQSAFRVFRRLTGQKLQSLSSSLQQGRHWSLVDYQQHLSNIKLDFRNKDID